MNMKLPGIVVTGASGFIGRHFVIAVSDKFRLFCIARRSQKEAGIPYNDNIHWLQADITNWENILAVFQYIKDKGGADYVLHLAGYYDFTQEKNPAYEHVNVIGTRHILDISEMLKIKRLIFSSSIAACKFPPKGKAITEESPVDEDFPYACSKRRGELLIKEYSESFPCAIVRLAAVFSDWCEYPMLYMLLKYWLSRNKLMSRMLSGSGESAIPYIHIRDLIKLFLRIIEINDILPQFATYIASPNGSVSHNELFKAVTRYYYGHGLKPFFMPKPMVYLGLIVISFLGWLKGKKTLERPWMAAYIDKKLCVDASATYNALGWKPTPRWHILRRLLFLTEKMISSPNDWIFRNEILIHKIAYRKSTAIYDILIESRELLVDKIIQEVFNPQNKHRFPNYRKMDHELLKWYIILNYQLVATTVKNRDRSMIPSYAKEIAYRRYIEGFKAREVKDLMIFTGNTMKKYLFAKQELKDWNQRLDDYIILTSQLAADEFEDTYEMLQSQAPEHIVSIKDLGIESLTSSKSLKQIVRLLEDMQGSMAAAAFAEAGEHLTAKEIDVTFKNYGALIKLKTSNE